jgi:hypothetical protein
MRPGSKMSSGTWISGPLGIFSVRDSRAVFVSAHVWAAGRRRASS